MPPLHGFDTSVSPWHYQNLAATHDGRSSSLCSYSLQRIRLAGGSSCHAMEPRHAAVQLSRLLLEAASRLLGCLKYMLATDLESEQQ